METLGRKIKMLRHQKNWTQEDASKQLGISIPAYSKIETGVTDINLSRLNQVAELFGTTASDLVASNESQEVRNYKAEIDTLNQKLHERDIAIFKLQSKVIELHEQVKK